MNYVNIHILDNILYLYHKEQEIDTKKGKVKDMKKKPFWRTEECNLTLLTKKARRFFEESDQVALDDIFGKCESIEEIEEVANELYNETFED